MLIKKITPTERLEPVTFKMLADNYGYDDISTQNNIDQEVLTPSGWRKIHAFGFVKSGITKRIETKNGALVCDVEHILLANRDGQYVEVHANQLDNTQHKLLSHDYEPIDFTISDSCEHRLYDISIDAPHHYYTSGIISHNSQLLCNNAITSMRGFGGNAQSGQDVLLVTFELDAIKTAMRCLGAATEVYLSQIIEKQDHVRKLARQMQATYDKKLLIYELAPDECSVNHLYALLDNLRRMHSWRPGVVILDYLDLMMSRNKDYNKDDYTRQKHVANEVRGFAKNENVLVYTATQTNRSGVDGEGGMIDLNKAAESFGKQFSLDYVISLNQSESDRQEIPPRLNLFIAKNRNGPKHQTVQCQINYQNMTVKELV